MNVQLKKYLSAYKLWRKIVACCMLALSIVFLISAAAGNDVEYIGLASFLAMLGFCLIQLYRANRFYADIEKSGMLAQVVSDFEGATSALNDDVRLGHKWIFVKGRERLLAYKDICQVYQYIHKSNGFEDGRSLKYVNKKGKHRVLCPLKLRGKSDSDAQEIVSFILSKNPSVKIGYR